MKKLFALILLAIVPFTAFSQEGGESVGDATCEAIMTDAWAAADAVMTTYSFAPLQQFYHQKTILDRVVLSDPENVLCHFDKSMGLSGNNGSETKTFGTDTVTVAIETPTESWATDAGYSKKGTVTVNDDTYMIIWWDGNSTSSKGYMVTGPNGFSGEGATMLNYIRWARTGVDQSVDVLLTHFNSTYLGTAANSTSGSWSDMAVYGRLEYNTTTKVITAQSTIIENQGMHGGTDGSFGCFKMYGTGTREGTLTVAKNVDGQTTTGMSVTSTDKDATDLDGMEVVDATTTTTGTAKNAATLTSEGVSFNWSCDQLNSAAGSGGAFENNTVSFTDSPTDVFGF